ncbi:TolC family protein [Pedobacter antarcticus]|uniref:TolC family protein n=1 Tax=Pedobacter antarcticus TaxID=34086 RepID=UPI001C55A652|nr:efflux transporter outer membrane subunit [Pedobacter antarcticus]
MKLYSKYTLFVLTAVLLLGSCKVSRDVALPEHTTPAQFQGADSSQVSGIASLSYTEIFNEPELLSLIDTAIKKNYDLQIAMKNMEAAGILLKQQSFRNVPQLSLQVNANTSRPSDHSLNGVTMSQFIGSSHIEDYNLAAGLSWEADIWGKLTQQKNAAAATYLQSAEARKAVQTRLVSQVATTYYNLLMLDTQLETARKNLALNTNTLRIIKMKFEAGQLTSLAVQQAADQQLTASALIPNLEQQAALAENALHVLTGRFPGKMNRVNRLENIPVDSSKVTGVPAEMLSLRPDVKQAELELVKANAKAGYTKASMYPSLVLSANGGLNSFKASNWLNIPASLFGNLTGGLTQPIFQRRELKTQYELALKDREAVVLKFRSTVLEAVAEVTDELVKTDKLQQQYQLTAQRVGLARVALKNADLLFNSGKADYLEVINAQRNALQSELELASLKTARLQAHIGLYRALGGGWK